jgi:putative ABC transport system substrate-binding protein
MIRRREFITLLGGATAWPLAARGQQGNRVRRIGVLMPGDENDPVRKTRLSAFALALAALGWTDGRNVRMDLRWYGGDINRIRALAAELVSLQPDIVLANGTPETVALQRETRTIPIVFATAIDPVATGIVARLNQLGGNVTGFANLEASLGGKWLELLSEIAPGLKRAAIMFNPDGAPVTAFMSSLETAAQSLKVVAIAAPVHSDVEIETAIIALGREPGGGLVVMPEVFTEAHRAPIIMAAARNGVPAVYGISEFARDGGLLSYGVDQVDILRRAASYVDRILRGEKPGDLPVQLVLLKRSNMNQSVSQCRVMSVLRNTAMSVELSGAGSPFFLSSQAFLFAEVVRVAAGLFGWKPPRAASLSEWPAACDARLYGRTCESTTRARAYRSNSRLRMQALSRCPGRRP